MLIMHSRIKKFKSVKSFFVSTPPYYLGLFEMSYPTVTLNRDDGTFFLNI